MPKAIQFRVNSVIYFEGDIEDRVYILQKGKIVLTSTDIETGNRVSEGIREGEFFGVKSALGHFPREETVMVLTDTTVLMFTSAEFETFAMTNTRIIMKMLKVFSNQLRKIHRQTESLLESSREMLPDDGLFSVGVAFFNSGKFPQALDIFQRYVNTYPTGVRISEARTYIQKASQGQSVKNISSSVKSVNASTNPSNEIPGLSTVEEGNDKTSLLLAQQLLGRKKYDEAYLQFQVVFEEESSPLLPDGLLGGAICLYYQEDFDGAIKMFTKMIATSPRHPKMGEALFYIGLCYGKKDEPQKKQIFIQKALSVADPELAARIKKIEESEE